MLLAGGSVGFACHVSCVLENENTTIQGKFSSQRIHRAARMIETYGGNPAVKQSFPFSYFMLPQGQGESAVLLYWSSAFNFFWDIFLQR